VAVRRPADGDRRVPAARALHEVSIVAPLEKTQPRDKFSGPLPAWRTPRDERHPHQPPPRGGAPESAHEVRATEGSWTLGRVVIREVNTPGTGAR